MLAYLFTLNVAFLEFQMNVSQVGLRSSRPSLLFVCFVALCPKSITMVNFFGHGGMISSPNHTFSWTSLNKRLVIVHILWLGCLDLPERPPKY